MQITDRGLCTFLHKFYTPMRSRKKQDTSSSPSSTPSPGVLSLREWSQLSTQLPKSEVECYSLLFPAPCRSQPSTITLPSNHVSNSPTSLHLHCLFLNPDPALPSPVLPQQPPSLQSCPSESTPHSCQRDSSGMKIPSPLVKNFQ